MRYPSLREGLVGAWCPSLGPTGYTLLDRSGYGNHGTLTNMDAGTDWVGSRYGWTLDFDGTDDFVEIPDRTSLSFTDNLAISFWLLAKTSGVTLANQHIFTHGRTDGQRRFAITIPSNDQILFYVTPDGTQANRAFRVTDVGSVRIGTWDHWTCVFASGNSQRLRIFRNGIEMNTTLTGTEPASIFDTSETARIGAGFNNLFQGCIDDLRYYARRPSLSELALLATEPGIGLKPKRTSVFFGSAVNRRRRLLTGMV